MGVVRYKIKNDRSGIVYRAYFEGDKVIVIWADKNGVTKQVYYEKRIYDRNIANGTWILV